MNIRHKLGSIYRDIRNNFYSPNPDAILLLGLNKSGTSVAINLLAHRADLSFTDDPMYKLGGFTEVLEGSISLSEYVNHHSYEFSKDIIRYPIDPEPVGLVNSFFNMSKLIVTVRNPVDNIKSILSRLNIPGDREGLDLDSMRIPHKNWYNMLTKSSNYVESLSRCWVEAYGQGELVNNENRVLFRYEEFMSDKIGYVTQKVSEIGCKPVNPIADIVNVQYQPKGTTMPNKDFFGKRNLNIIKNETGKIAGELGYNIK